MKKIMFVLLIAVLSIGFLVAQADKSKIEVDERYNVAATDTGNYLKINGRSDQFDATTGASKFKATSGFNAWYRSTDNKTTLPAGVRGLFLYPLASDATRTDDDFKVSKAADGVITITYLHRGNAYELVTDNKGMLNVETGAKIATGIAPLVDGKIGSVDAKYLKSGIASNSPEAGKMINADWKKITLVTDKPTAAQYYTGNLQLALNSNILTVKGTLNLKK